MREVEPGTVLTVGADGMRERRYSRLETRPHADDAEQSVARVRELLYDIVRRQLVADVPRCVLLSGGLDSSAVTALSAALLAEEGERVRTFAVDFVGQTQHFRPDPLRATPDTPYVHDVAEHVGAEHSDIVLDNETLTDPQLRRRVVAALDQPVGMGRYVRVAVPALQGDPRALHRRALRRVGG
jgi:asparagine synthase (glutamine-hydrolysing)